MDGLTGYKTAIAEQLPDARAVMDPFHVVKLASDALDRARRQVQQTRLAGLFADQRHMIVEVTWCAYQKMIDAYQHPDKAHGRALMSALIDSIATGVPAGIQEIARLGRTLKRRSEDILAYFDHPGTSNGPTEAINGRLKHLRGIVQGLAQPCSLHHPQPPRSRRIQTPITPSNLKCP